MFLEHIIWPLETSQQCEPRALITHNMLINGRSKTDRNSPEDKYGAKQLTIPVIGSLQRNSKHKRQHKPSIIKPTSAAHTVPQTKHIG
jgi:hypothetical protein